ncbi:thioredoxin fold domain-containing protein [bacterium]|nr:thioredoxin fold domain-containing protein [bacterium]
MSGMTKINDDQFDAEVLKADRLTLVDFGTPWCGPCKKLHHLMDEIGNEFGEKIKVFEVDASESQKTAMKYSITSVPQLLFFKDGIVKEAVVGLIGKSKIEEKIEKYL